MEPVTIAIIGAVVFGVVVAVSAFVRQLILSRDKNLNDKAQNKALELEANYHKRRPDMIDFGLVHGVPLRRLKEGLQPEMFADIGHACWSGHCGH